MLQNEIILESLGRQWRQDRLAEANGQRLQTWLRNLRKSAGR
jgi:hypothetical protein